MADSGSTPDQNMTQWVRRTGLVAFLVIGIAIWMMASFKYEPRDLPHGFRSPVLAIELARNTAEVRQIAGDLSDSSREAIRANIKADFVFIASYWSLLVLMSGLLGRGSGVRYTWGAVIAAVCVTAGAAFDVAENLHILTLLDVQLRDTSAQMVEAVRSSSLAKWALIFIANGILSQLFVAGRSWITFVGALFLLSAMLGLIGLFHNPAIEWAFSVMAAGIVAVSLLFTISPAKFLRRFLPLKKM